MIKILNKYRITSFDYFYLFVIVIYMAQATPETSRMTGSLSGNPIPLLLPMVLTYILCKKHTVNFNNKNFRFILIIYSIWAICSLIKYKTFTTEELSYHFFVVYAIVIAYIQNQIYGYKLLPIYENIMVLFCKIAIVGWLIGVLLPFSSSFFRMFTETGYGNNVLYLFTWMDPAKGQVYSGIPRNAGCTWEPGHFAIMITLAIFCNLCQNGIKFRNNKNIWWLLVALATTQSTTGFFTALIIYSIFVIKKINLKYVLLFTIVMIPLIYGLMQLDFMGKKVTTKLTEAQDVTRMEEQFAWNAAKHEEGEYLGSIDRFDAMVFEWMNVIHDPVLGYSRNIEHSYFRTNITSNFVLANGLVKILGMFGLPLGLYFFYILYRSSLKMARDSNEQRLFSLFILLCLSAISYQILMKPIFTAFWFYGFFTNKNYIRTSIRKKPFTV